MSTVATTTPELDLAVGQALASNWTTELLEMVRAGLHKQLLAAGFDIYGLIALHDRTSAMHEARWCGLALGDPVNGTRFRVMVDFSMRIDSLLGEDCRIMLLAQQREGQAAFTREKLAEFALDWPKLVLMPSQVLVQLAEGLQESVGNKLLERCEQARAAFVQALTETLSA